MKDRTTIIEDYTIREALLEDASAIWQAIDTQRDYLVTWLPFVDRLTREEDEEAFLAGILAVPYKERNLVYVIEKGEEFCGLAGFVSTDWENHRTEIGYWLLPEHQGQGVMTHCVRYLCEWAIAYRSINRIQIRCAVGNASSNAIPRRLGFHLEGTEREGELLASGEYADINVYSLLKKEISQLLLPHGIERSGYIYVLRDEEPQEVKQAIIPDLAEVSEKAYTYEEVRKKYSRAYAPWSAQDDEELMNMRAVGISIKDLSRHFGRSRGAISSRIKKLTGGE